MRRVLLRASVVVAMACGARAARADEWAGVLALGCGGIVWPEDAGGGELIGRGLAPARVAGVETRYTSWFGLPEWSTRAATLWVGRAPARVAAGVALTGERALGWRGAGAGLGVARPWAGAGVGFRVRDEPGRPRPSGRSASVLDLTAAGGGWARIAPGLRLALATGRLWASVRSELPADPAEACLYLGDGDLGAAIAWRTEADGTRETALALRLAGGPLTLVAGARTPPWRSALAIEADWQGCAMGCAVELHPVLGTTTRLGFGWRAR